MKQNTASCYILMKEQRCILVFCYQRVSPTDRLWMTILSNAFEQLPSNTLAPYWSANGTPFPCLYLKAKFYKSKWHFSDYRFEN